MQLNRKKSQLNPSTSTATSVNKIVDDLLDSYGPRLNGKNISLETDLEPTSAVIDSRLIQTAIQSLLENAIDSMPHGGILTATLIDGKHQWELEVADTSGIAYSTHEPRDPVKDQGELPVIIPFPETESLRDAHRNASELGGQIQTWDCPQGGTAHVLVIPRSPSNRPDTGLSNPDQA